MVVVFNWLWPVYSGGFVVLVLLFALCVFDALVVLLFF